MVATGFTRSYMPQVFFSLYILNTWGSGGHHVERGVHCLNLKQLGTGCFLKYEISMRDDKSVIFAKHV